MDFDIIFVEVIIMTVSKAQMRATAKYEKNNYDDIRLRVKKGERELIKAHAEKQGKSLNAYINDLIKADMELHQG